MIEESTLIEAFSIALLTLTIPIIEAALTHTDPLSLSLLSLTTLSVSLAFQVLIYQYCLWRLRMFAAFLTATFVIWSAYLLYKALLDDYIIAFITFLTLWLPLFVIMLALMASSRRIRECGESVTLPELIRVVEGTFRRILRKRGAGGGI